MLLSVRLAFTTLRHSKGGNTDETVAARPPIGPMD